MESGLRLVVELPAAVGVAPAVQGPGPAGSGGGLQDAGSHADLGGAVLALAALATHVDAAVRDLVGRVGADGIDHDLVDAAVDDA